MNKSMNKFHFNRQEDGTMHSSGQTYDAKKAVINDYLQNLTAVIDKFKSNENLSGTDILEIRRHIANARAVASGYADFNGDEKGHFKFMCDLADAFEEATNFIDDSDRYL